MGVSAEVAAGAGLTQAEIDAINGVDAEQDDAALAEIAGDDEAGSDDDADDEDGDDEDSDEDAAGDDGDNDSAADDQGAADSDNSADQGAGEDEGSADVTDLFAGLDLPEVAFSPRVTGELLPEFATAIDKVYDDTDAKLDAIEDKFQQGDLDEREKRAEIRRVERERDLEVRKLTAANSNAQIDEQRWVAEQDTFFKQYEGYKQPLLFNALNAEVLRINALPESAGKSGIEILLAAKRSIDNQIKAVTGALPDAGKQKQGATKPKAARPDVQTLGGVPAAAAPDTGQDRFAALDRLKGEALEAALSKLSEADRSDYLAGR